jgi:hypothetical protein
MMTPIPFLPGTPANQTPQPADSVAPGLFDLSLLLAGVGLLPSPDAEIAVSQDDKPLDTPQEKDSTSPEELLALLQSGGIDATLFVANNIQPPAVATGSSGATQNRTGLLPAGLSPLPLNITLSTTTQTTSGKLDPLVPGADENPETASVMKTVFPVLTGIDKGTPTPGMGKISSAARESNQTVLLAAPLQQATQEIPGTTHGNAHSNSNPSIASPAAIADLSPSGILQPSVVLASQASHTSPVQTYLQTQVGTPAWREEFAGTVSMLTQSGRHSAELTLNPAGLGPIEVRINMNDGVAVVTFNAQQAPTRDAIESALPQLKEMLGESGINLGQATVGGQQSGNQPGGSMPRNTPSSGIDSSSDAIDPVRITHIAVRGNIDTFA